jgi:hypothetical protein
MESVETSRQSKVSKLDMSSTIQEDVVGLNITTKSQYLCREILLPNKDSA